MGLLSSGQAFGAVTLCSMWGTDDTVLLLEVTFLGHAHDTAQAM